MRFNLRRHLLCVSSIYIIFIFVFLLFIQITKQEITLKKKCLEIAMVILKSFQCHKKCSFIFDCLKNQHRSERQQSNFANCHHYSAGLGLELKKWWNFVPTKWMPSNKKLVKFEINLFLTCKKHFKSMVNVSTHIFQEWYRTSAYTGILRDFRFSVTRKIAQN